MNKFFLAFLFVTHLLSEEIHYVDGLPIKVNQYGPVAPGELYTTIIRDLRSVDPKCYALILSNDSTTIPFIEKGCFFDFKKYPDGNFTLCLRKEEGAKQECSKWQIRDPALNILAKYPNFPLKPGEMPNFHEFIRTANGNVMFITDQIIPIQLNNQKRSLRYNVIYEVTPEGHVVFEWKTIDHFNVSDMVSGIGRSNSSFMPIDLTHSNAIFIDHDNNILLSSRHVNEVTKIDRQTGEVIWRLGGKNSYFTFVNDPLNGISHQHTPSRLDNGHILIYDNGNSRSPPISRVVEYELDEENMTATLVWEYRAKSFTNCMGSAQRLSNGNTLIGWGSTHKNDNSIIEVTPNKEVVLSIKLPTNPFYQIYRAYKFE